jgi:transcriptional regulator with XRE-family HTH domain
MSESRTEATVGQVVGLSLRTLRAERGLTQEQAVELIRAAGLPWTRANVASLESGRRQDLAFTDLVLLSRAFGVPLRRWLEANGATYFVSLAAGRTSGSYAPWTLNVVLAGLLSGARPDEPVEVATTWDSEPIHLEAELHAAERLGIGPDRLRQVATRLWGRRLVEERERRLQVAQVAGSPTTHRGHITRRLLSELRAATQTEPAGG